MNRLVNGLVHNTETDSFFFWLGRTLIRFFGAIMDCGGFGTVAVADMACLSDCCDRYVVPGAYVPPVGPVCSVVNAGPVSATVANSGAAICWPDSDVLVFFRPMQISL